MFCVFYLYTCQNVDPSHSQGPPVPSLVGPLFTEHVRYIINVAFIIALYLSFSFIYWCQEEVHETL